MGHPLPPTQTTYFSTDLGKMVLGDSKEVLSHQFEEDSVNLIMTSPPFGLIREKEYGNVAADEYLDWFRPFAEAFHRVLRDDGSFVIDIGGAWNKGEPTRNLYHYKLLIMLCEEFGFHLAQDFFWWNPSKLPTPAEWVTVRRIRVKDALNCVWWLSPTPWPKASNRRVLQPYSDSMEELLENGYDAKKRPSGHNISENFDTRNKGSIPPNLIAAANTESQGRYQRYCRENDIDRHPARFPSELPEFFIRMLTDPGDLVVDPFAGSCVTGEVAERTQRRWVCIDNEETYLKGAIGRFEGPEEEDEQKSLDLDEESFSKAVYKQLDESSYYSIFKPGLFWNGVEDDRLRKDGGRTRHSKNEDDGEED